MFSIKKFVTNQEIKALKKWTIDNKDNETFTVVDDYVSFSYNRKSTRHTIEDSFKNDFPVEAYNIQKRIIDFFKLSNVRYPEYHSGIVASYADIGSVLGDHIDPIYYPETQTIHCNVLVSKPKKGGIFYYGGVPVTQGVGDLVVSNVGSTSHSVSEIQGSPRIVWLFGFCLENKDWDRLEKEHNK